jgi:hypothetical protein
MRIGILRQACPSASSFFSTRLSVVLVVPNSIARTLMGGSCAPAAAAARLVLNAGKSPPGGGGVPAGAALPHWPRSSPDNQAPRERAGDGAWLHPARTTR